jgi:hypothetical protein
MNTSPRFFRFWASRRRSAVLPTPQEERFGGPPVIVISDCVSGASPRRRSPSARPRAHARRHQPFRLLASCRRLSATQRRQRTSGRRRAPRPSFLAVRTARLYTPSAG